jgi:nitroimidazol reductase NimA-like FMN-containing flavoprotein (pyridoxamine 5'-phosphate oxidase superfamily)
MHTKPQKLAGPLMLKFKPFEEKFLERNEIGRLATISRDGFPHVVPVSYLYYHEKICIAVDYGTRKYRNMLENNKIAFVVDTINPNQGLLILGKVRIIEKGKEFKQIYKGFNEKFAWVRASPWKEGEAPFVEVQPHRKVNWGLSG